MNGNGMGFDLHAVSRRWLGRGIVGLAAIGLGLSLSAQPAAAQAVYQYTGNPFTLFSCGPSGSGGTLLCSTPAPNNPNTSYTATDFVSATLTLDAALPANMAITDVRNLPGFQLTMSDVQHTVTNAQQQGMFAEVATGASGQIVAWRLVINTGGLENGGIATQNSQFVADSGTLACCDPTVSGNLARNSNMPGTWSSGNQPPTPAAATRNLITLVASPELNLTTGQVNGLSDKLNNALASIQAGQNKQAVNQLTAFNSSVQSWQKTGKLSAQTAATLTAAANAIIAML